MLTLVVWMKWSCDGSVIRDLLVQKHSIATYNNTIPKTKHQICLGVFHTAKSSEFIDNMTGKQLDARGKKKSLNPVNL